MDDKYTYKIFKDVLLDYVKQSFAPEANIEIHNIVKNNSFELECMVIIESGKSVSPNFYLQLYYQEYLRGASIESIVAEMTEKYNELQNEDFSSFSMDIGNCMDKIVCRLVSYEKNSRLLKEIPYIPFLDLAIIFYCLVVENENGIGSIRISNKIMAEWKITIKMLYQIAICNTEKLFPKVICPLQSMLEHMLESKRKEVPEVFDSIDSYNLQYAEAPFVLTNKKGINGAAAILYPDCLKEIGNIAGENLYIIPSSIHELLIIPDDRHILPEKLKKMVREVNASCVVSEEVLSDMVYHYSIEKNIIEICS